MQLSWGQVALAAAFVLLMLLTGFAKPLEPEPVPATPTKEAGQEMQELLKKLEKRKKLIRSEGTHKYQVCNGLGNQLIAHVGNIVHAVRLEMNVQILDAYITNGVQSARGEDGVLLDVTAQWGSFVKLSAVFDTDHLLSVIASHGVEAVLVPYSSELHGDLPCQWMVGEAPGAETTKLYGDILRAFRPSPVVKKIVDAVQKETESVGNSVCVHHRNAQDWKDHCKAWENIPDGVWRHNCDLDTEHTLSDAVFNRLLPQENDAQRNSAVFYVGDGVPPSELSDFGYKVLTRRGILAESDIWGSEDSGEAKTGSGLDVTLEDLRPMLTQKNKACPGNVRDVCAVVDYFTCASMPGFVGNSVSTWSALQIAYRQGSGTWYNGRSIPLAGMFDVYPIAIVYTYTESSAKVGQLLLMTSILSVKRYNPASPVHVLYMGKEDIQFRRWLRDQGVNVHNQEPSWLDDIRSMFKNGNAERSHLFMHLGNYIGTWQRVDIPLHINAEFVLLLDCDTVVTSSFGYKDFGLEMTGSIAFSAEMTEDWEEPWNAGVALLNVPHLRETYDDFLSFIKTHRKNEPYEVQTSAGIIEAPSDQGAYLTFYGKTKKFLKRTFNVKPYYKMTALEDGKIVHFHGAKPHDYMGHWIGVECNPAVRFICEKTDDFPILCRSLKTFAKSMLSSGPELLENYCTASFKDNANSRICVRFMWRLSKMDDKFLKLGSSCEKLMLNTVHTGWGKNLVL
eukprot:TRINITY_DN3824_c0_g2_i2.p1 TRINITY_DN3824_c0_g2~~TRINITY_DN3824_c0_g2_i2.p1  ORF type:complete len:733 (+),score=267.79 TRINITY_DN3824_c0_g2_i2:71-2269(+)